MDLSYSKSLGVVCFPSLIQENWWVNITSSKDLLNFIENAEIDFIQKILDALKSEFQKEDYFDDLLDFYICAIWKLGQLSNKIYFKDFFVCLGEDREYFIKYLEDGSLHCPFVSHEVMNQYPFEILDLLGIDKEY